MSFFTRYLCSVNTRLLAHVKILFSYELRYEREWKSTIHLQKESSHINLKYVLIFVVTGQVYDSNLFFVEVRCVRPIGLKNWCTYIATWNQNLPLRQFYLDWQRRFYSNFQSLSIDVQLSDMFDLHLLVLELVEQYIHFYYQVLMLLHRITRSSDYEPAHER